MSRKKPKRPKLSTTANPHFCTPPWILEPVRKLAWDGRITLDPCSNADSVVDAHVEWRGRRPGRAAAGVWMDGLDGVWGRAAYAVAGRTRLAHPPGRIPVVYINPPFTRGVVEQWLARCNEWSRSTLFPLHIVALIPARLSASWYKKYCYPGSGAAAAVCQLGKRVRFLGAESPCPWEMSLVYWGPDPALFAECVQTIGAIYRVYDVEEELGTLGRAKMLVEMPLVAFKPQSVAVPCPCGAAPGDCPICEARRAVS